MNFIYSVEELPRKEVMLVDVKIEYQNEMLESRERKKKGGII
jgi:hypothetical protein